MTSFQFKTITEDGKSLKVLYVDGHNEAENSAFLNKPAISIAADINFMFKPWQKVVWEKKKMSYQH